MNETPQTLRAKSAQGIKLAITMSNERARLGLLDYAQELLDQARQLEQAATNITVVVIDPDIAGEKKTP
jgi:hypothetical protein